MKSITKRKLNLKEINELVKAAFGGAAEAVNITELEEGWFNAIYLVSLNDGREVVLKVAPSSDVKIMRYEKDIMFAEVEVMRLLKKDGHIPVPDIYFYDNTGTIIKNEYFFMEKINGMDYSKVKDTLTEKQRETIETELGQLNRSINNIKGFEFGLFAQSEYKSGNWSEAFLRMVRAVLQDGKDYNVSLPLSYDEIEELFLSRLQVFESVKEASLVHWDLHDGNVFVNEEGKIVGIIDFERALWGDPLLEVYFGDFFNNTYFCKGYGSIDLITDEAKCRRSLYNIYLYLIMVIECKYRNFEDEGHIKWTNDMLGNEISKLLSMQTA